MPDSTKILQNDRYFILKDAKDLAKLYEDERGDEAKSTTNVVRVKQGQLEKMLCVFCSGDLICFCV